MSLPNPSPIKKNLCPKCGEFVDCATHSSDLMDKPEGRKPKPGDLSLCIGCGNPMIFTEDLGLRDATKEEIESLDDAQALGIIKMIWAIRIARANRKPKSETRN